MDGVGHHVFVSYAHADADYVGRLVTYLREHGVPTRYDADIPSGAQWMDALREMIGTCSAVVLVMSPAAAASPTVEEELHEARRMSRPIRPLRLAGTSWFGIHGIQFEDVTGGRLPDLEYVAQLRAGTATTSGTTVRRPWMVPRLEARTIDRPELTEAVLRLLTSAEGGTVGATTGVFGAGGFGKTTVAALVCHRAEVAAHFPGGLLWVSIGEDRTAAQLAAIINDLCWHLSGDKPNLADPEQAGFRLGQLLDQRPPTLLVIDDVWRTAQLSPFLLGGVTATRLVTTRMERVLPEDATAVAVDEMNVGQARELLLAGLPPVPEPVCQELLVRTGGWALLIAMVNGALRRSVRDGTDIASAAAHLARRLADEGPSTVDVSARIGRDRVVAATVKRSLDLLSDADRRHYLLLAAFPEDVDIAIDVIALLWAMSVPKTRRLCAELAELSLVTGYRPELGSLRLHDVLRAFARHELGEADLPDAHLGLLRRAANLLAPHEAGLAVRPWWTLPESARYLWQHVAFHLVEAGRVDELTGLVLDLRWIENRVRRFGAADTDTDLSYVDDPVAVELRRTLTRESHLLGPIEPAHSHADVLASRLGGTPTLAPLVVLFQTTWDTRVMRLTNTWPVPDTNPATIRVLAGHTGRVTAIAVAPDGTWLATASHDRTVRLWDVVTGEQRAILSGHEDAVTSVEISPDGTWLASASWDCTVRIWDATTGAARHVLTGHDAVVSGVAIAADGRWLASTSWDGAVLTWDAGTGRLRWASEGSADGTSRVSIARDGSWLVTGDRDFVARVWDSTTGALRRTLAGHEDWVTGLAIAPDGRHVVTTSHDRTMRVWDANTADCVVLTDDSTGTMTCVAFGSDSSSLATGGQDGSVTLWDGVTGQHRARLTGHSSQVSGVVISPDGRWLATASDDHTVRIWDAAVGASQTSTRHVVGGTGATVVAPDGEWFATAGPGGSIELWDGDTGAHRSSLSHPDLTVTALAVHGTWLVAAGSRRLLFWNSTTLVTLVTDTHHSDSMSGLAIAADGTWLATCADDGTTTLIWDTRTMELLGHHVSRPQSRITASPTDRALAVAGGTVEVVEMVEVPPAGSRTTPAEAVLTFPGYVEVDRLPSLRRHAPRNFYQGGRVVAFFPDGLSVVAGATSGRCSVWTVPHDEETAEAIGHSGRITGVVVAPHGRWFASASEDQTLRLWSQSGQNLATMRVDAPFTAIACHPHGQRLFVIGDHGRARYAFDVSESVTPHEGTRDTPLSPASAGAIKPRFDYWLGLREEDLNRAERSFVEALQAAAVRTPIVGLLSRPEDGVLVASVHLVRQHDFVLRSTIAVYVVGGHMYAGLLDEDWPPQRETPQQMTAHGSPKKLATEAIQWFQSMAAGSQQT
jgi:WD40 repeat protein